MKQAERKAHKLALLDFLSLKALEAEFAAPLPPVPAPDRFGWHEPVVVKIRMGRARWAIFDRPQSLRAVAKQLTKLRASCFQEWSAS